jgi:hypothetical protein
MKRKPVFSRLTVETFLGDQCQVVGEMLGEYTNGYYVVGSESWCKTPLPGYECKPAQFIKFREKGKRKVRGIFKNRIVEVLAL